jgi:hypothetical protein
MPISTCSTLRLNGAPSIKNTIRLSAIMLITGKILDENRTSSITTPRSCVQTGKQEHLSVSTKKVVPCKQHASNRMDGKSKNTILLTTRRNSVKTRNAVAISSVPFTMEERTGEQSMRKITEKLCFHEPEIRWSSCCL